MNIALCDDEKVFLREMTDRLCGCRAVESVDQFSDLETFLTAVQSGKKYHVVLMDIDWGRDQTGMDTAEKLYALCPDTKIIYVTGYNDRFSQHIFLHKANLSGYLTKPVDPALLEANLRKAEQDLASRGSSVLVLRPHGKPVSIPLRDIFYLESRGHTVSVHTAGETISVYERLSIIEERLPAWFAQCHKSFVVNLREIQRFQDSGVLLKNGEQVPVSRARYAQTKETYIRLMSELF